jgi:hypothetical protein
METTAVNNTGVATTNGASSNILGVGKFPFIHIASEIIIIGGIAYYFNKKMSELNKELVDVKTKLSELQSRPQVAAELDKKVIDEFTEYHKYTSAHIQKLYSTIKILSEKIDALDYSETPPISPKSTVRNRFVPPTTSISVTEKPSIPVSVSRIVVSRQNTHTIPSQSSKIEIIDEESEDIKREQSSPLPQTDDLSPEKLDEELADELSELEDQNVLPSDSSVVSTTDIIQTSTTPEPLEFVSVKKKVSKKKTK